jgi:hypothetical protein
MKIAVDFDGTIVEDAYPDIGKPMLFAFETLKELQRQKHQLILWTYRSGTELEAAVEFCRENGVEFYAVNNSYPEEIYDTAYSRKIHAHVFIDDRNLGGFPGWSKVWQMITGDNPDETAAQLEKDNDRQGIWQKIIGKKQ